jgi:hypothetical protein
MAAEKRGGAGERAAVAKKRKGRVFKVDTDKTVLAFANGATATEGGSLCGLK